jgi:uncharacterized repeat protein (TIGR04138 family)
MQAINFDDVLDRIVARDVRYHRDAYVFLREALEHAQKAASKANRHHPRHVNALELLDGIRAYALDSFGPMALTVLEEWGIRSCEDFGNIVFLMVESDLLRITEQDRLEHFKGAYAFEEAFRRPFLPSRKQADPPAPAAESVEEVGKN